MLYRCIAPDMGMSDVWKEMHAYEYIVKCMCTFVFFITHSQNCRCVYSLSLSKIWWAWSLCAGSCGIYQVLCEELASKAADLQTEKDDLTQV